MAPTASPSSAPHRFFDQPKAVWATAFACVVGFMSIGLVDPILTSIGEGLNATPTQVSMLFTSYFLVTSVMMLLTGFVSSRLGGRKTLLLGAFLIVVFAGMAGTSDSVAELVMFRAGWGLGNAFFVVTALSVIVAASRGGTGSAILMYEAALGLGISAGPLLGAALGAHSWRYPFFGTATLMAIGFIAIAIFLPEQPRPAKKTALSAPLRALGQPGLLTTAVSGLLYYYAFFTVLAFVPFVLRMSPHAIGLIFFGWGVLLALFSVMVAPRLQARFSTIGLLSACLGLFAVLLIVMAVAPAPVIAACVVLSGALMGVCNTVYTEMALEVSDVPRPVASAGYNFLRWFAGVIAPFAAPELAHAFGTEVSFVVAATAALVAPILLVARRATLGRYGLSRHTQSAPAAHPATAPQTAGGGQTAAGCILAAVDGTEADFAILDRAVILAGEQSVGVSVLHLRLTEIFDEDAATVEDARTADAVLARALKHLESTNGSIPGGGTVLRSTVGQAAATVLEWVERTQAAALVIGQAHAHDLTDRVHGSLSDAVQHLSDDDLSLIVVPEAS